MTRIAARSHDGDILNTYRYLRAAMIALLVMLLLSVGYQWWFVNDHSCWLTSISAYYFTPARPVFIGSLFALGTCLIVYKGHSDAEDVLLNFSGFMAFVVAMVPTVPDRTCPGLDYAPTPAALANSVQNNIWTLIVVALIAAGVRWLLRRDLSSGRRMDREGWIATIICGAVLVAELVLFLRAPNSFIAASHGIAAGTMVAGVIAVMVLSALTVEDRQEGDPDKSRLYKRWYVGIAIVLAIALGFAILAAQVGAISDHLIIVAEVIIIVCFIVYWVVQSHELWHLDSAGDHTEGRRAARVAS
jgi:hypothetical protein